MITLETMPYKISLDAESIKLIYDKFGYNWIPTRYFKTLFQRPTKIYELFLKGVEKEKWNENLINRDGSGIEADHYMERGNFWRISLAGIYALYKVYNIDDGLELLAKKILLGEFDENQYRFTRHPRQKPQGIQELY